MNILETIGFIVPKRKKVKDLDWTRNQVIQALHRNGILQEKAKRDRRSLDYIERQIISAVRSLAMEMGFSREWINGNEMDGERDWSLVNEPVKVVAKFAFYNSGEYPNNPRAEFHVTESNHPSFPVHGNVSAEDLQKCGFKIPKTPTFNEWDKKGRPFFRGEKS